MYTRTMSFNNSDDSKYHKYSHELQKLYQRVLDCGRDREAADCIDVEIREKITEAMLDWDLGRSDLHALGRLINLCENRECPPEPTPEIQFNPR